jgi:glucose-6-phosphate 1-dehydrogenase
MDGSLTASGSDSPDGAGPAPPCTLVIFGGFGDLTKRLLMPSLHNMRRAGLLADGFKVVAVDHNERTDETYRAELTEAVEAFVATAGGEASAPGLDEGTWAWVRERLAYQTGDFEDDATYKALQGRITGNCVFYLATAARFFGPVLTRLSDSFLLREADGAFRRVVVEKPFGHDLASAQALNRLIAAKMAESQVFRIDHFLGKETVQNLMALRFSNGIFEPLWNRQHIDHVQITAAETVGVESRGRFYEATGALRDMVPNHMFQLLAMTAMEPPNSFDADAVRSEKTKVLTAIKPLSAETLPRKVVRGQYVAGKIGGRDVPTYRAEPDVAPDSNTETYIAMRLEIDNFRWAGVPFYIRTGKRLAARRTEIVIHFKQAPYAMFRDTPVDALTPNLMVVHVQPSEGITLNLSAKIPGPTVRLGAVGMDFRYADHFKPMSSTGYETLLYDVMIGDATLFQRADTIEAGWSVVQPILDQQTLHQQALDQQAGSPSLQVQPYAAGSSGPPAADAMLERDGRQWLKL